MLMILKSLFPAQKSSLSLIYISPSLLDSFLKIYSKGTSRLLFFPQSGLSPTVHRCRCWHQYLPSHPVKTPNCAFYHPFCSHCISYPTNIQSCWLWLMNIVQFTPLLPITTIMTSLRSSNPSFFLNCTHYSSPLTGLSSSLIIHPASSEIYLECKSDLPLLC